MNIQVKYWASDRTPQAFLQTATSDENGDWVVQGIPPGKVAITATSERFVTFNRIVDVDRGLDLGTKHDLGTIVLKRGTHLTVEVIDDLDQPVPDPRVGYSTSVVHGDRDGIAELRRIAPGEALDLRISAPHHVSTKVVLSPPLPAVVPVRLTRSLTVVGRYLDHQQRPVAEGVAKIKQGRDSWDRQIASSGDFEIDLKPGTAVDILLSSPTTRELRIPISEGSPGELRDLGDFIAPNDLRVIGYLTDPEGAPVPNARIWTTRESRGAPILAWMHGDLLEAHSRNDGSFELTGLDGRQS